jgi:hypothetical protein
LLEQIARWPETGIARALHGPYQVDVSQLQQTVLPYPQFNRKPARALRASRSLDKDIEIMALKGTIESGTWSVESETSPVPQGGFSCRIRVTHGSPGQRFIHTFAHHRTCASETAAVLDGLREGMVWVDLKLHHAFEL